MTRDWTAPLFLEGSGEEATLLVHGYTGHPGHWLPLAEVLHGEGYTVSAPLLAGHGPEYRPDVAWREWLESIVSAGNAVAGHRRLHLIGLSMGGLLSVLAAPRLGATSLTAINPPLLVSDRRAYAAPLARRLVSTSPAYPEPVPDPDLAHLWLPPEEHSVAAVDALVRVAWHAWWTAGRLRRPSLVIQSRTDETVSPVSGRLLARRLRARLEWVETRHNALLDPARDVLHALILDHVRRPSERSLGN